MENEEIKKYLAEIGRKGGKAPSPFKKYATNAERCRAYRERKKTEADDSVTPAKPNSGYKP